VSRDLCEWFVLLVTRLTGLGFPYGINQEYFRLGDVFEGYMAATGWRLQPNEDYSGLNRNNI